VTYKNTRGFTIVELMIAVTITSIVVLAAYGLMNATTSNFDNEDDRVQLRANLRSAEMLLQRDIGRTGFRANLLDSSGGLYVTQSASTSSDVTFQSLRLSSTTVDGQSFSQLTIVADITDYSAFTIARATGATLNLSSTDLQTVQTNDCLIKLAAKKETQYTTTDGVTCGLGYCQNCEDGKAESGAAARFDEAFELAFSEASAVRLSVKENPLHSDIRLLNRTVKPAGRTVTLNSTFAPPPEHHYSAQMREELISPITAMTYTVMRDSSNNERVLVRCTHGIEHLGEQLGLVHAGSVTIPAYSCSVILRNVDDFTIRPMTANTTLDTAVGSIVQPGSAIPVPTINVNTISALIIHIRAHGSVRVKNSAYDATENATAFDPPFFAQTIAAPSTGLGGSLGKVPTVEPIIYSSENILFAAPIMSRIDSSENHPLYGNAIMFSNIAH